MRISLCLTLLALLLGAAGTSETAAQARRPAPVFVIVLENHELPEVIGNPEAPFLNRLARRGALAVRYHAVAHPSLPNYLALVAGSTFGITEDCLDCTVTGPNLATQLSRAGISWKAYMGGLPRPCFTRGDSGSYAKRHNPFAYFPAITTVPRRCARIVPATRLRADLAAHRLPAFGWLSPNLCQAAHDCPLGAADVYLSRIVPSIRRRLGPHGLLIVTFDEGVGNAGGGGRVATVLAGPDVPPGLRVRRAVNHYSLLAALERRFGLPFLGAAANAPPLVPWLFGQSH
ncbi:MAG TPA: alkaline phosphatase family protein [Solirubrobacterales bacterium]|nr:alkaline phosphatase family protein [Solirubrobacterales bacterium]